MNLINNVIASVSIGASSGAAEGLLNPQASASTIGVIAVMGTGLVLWMSSRFEKRDKADAEYRERLAAALASDRKQFHTKLASIEQRILNLPCPQCEHVHIAEGDI